ncbi:hypothetical protein TNCT_338321 [Trichonephila clavata]|uniref:Uncharacterized protein n=1 Tax=Trichonephila clavata TaxID=2740835 RepID=A0A8X6H7Q5_TRICU|nr:hypothetical protein TNCT_338321 [Trichonephila clavata]
MVKGKGLKRKFEKQLGALIAFVGTSTEDDKEVLSFKLTQFERLNIKYESVEEEIFTRLGQMKSLTILMEKLPPAMSILRNSW